MSDSESDVDTQRKNSFADSESDDANLSDSGDEQPERKRKKMSSGKKKASKKKKKKTGVSAFFMDEADEASDEEEEEEEAEEKYSDEDDDPEHERYMNEVIAEQNRRREMERTAATDWSEGAEQIASRIEQKYKDSYQEVSVADMDDAGHTEVSQQSLLPAVGDPKLWVVKCKVGSERLLALSLMNKALHLAREGRRLGVRSAVVGSAKGFVYIEADSEPEARAAVRSFRLLMAWSMQLVPIGDMTAVLSAKKRRKPVKPGDWVRLKRGAYKGDLAQAVEVLESGTKVVVRAIPRLDLAALKLPPEQQRQRRGQGQPRPPQKFFNYTEVRQAGGDVQRKRMPGAASKYDFFQNNYYANGFLLKELNAAAVSAENVLPTVEELQRFEERKAAAGDGAAGDGGGGGYGSDEDGPGGAAGRGGGAGAAGAAAGAAALAADLAQLAAKEETITLVKGDTVRVTEGDLKGLMGKVQSTDGGGGGGKEGGGVVKVMIASAELRGQVLDFLPEQLLKFIKVGGHAKVVGGRWAGETGTVVALAEAPADSGGGGGGGAGDWTATLLTDRASREIQVRVAVLQETSEIAAGLDSLRGYELYDLVQLGHAEVGVVVHVGSQDLRVLTNTGAARTCRPEELRGKRNHVSRRAVALDARQAQLRGGDMVNVLEGQHAGRAATVKHVHRAVLFVHSKNHTQNSGVFVVRARSCALAGAAAAQAKNLLAPTFAQNAAAPPAPDQPAPGRPAAVGNRGRVRDEMIAKSIKITKGPLKGYLGTVIDTTDTHVKVEVHTKAKKVTMSRQHVKVVGDERGGLGAPRGASSAGGDHVPATPFLTAATPMHAGGQTPMHTGMMTPMHEGAQTPTHMPYTPSHSGGADVWRPGAMDTPMHAGGSTPSGSTRGWGEDDAFNPRTPGSERSFAPGSERSGVAATPGSARLSESRSSLSSWHPAGAPGSERSELGGGGGGGGALGAGTPFDAGTPAAAEREEGKWATEGVVVEVADRGGAQAEVLAPPQGAGPQAALRVRLLEGGETLTLRLGDARPAVPEKKDRVRVVSGQDTGLEGVLVGVDSQDGILKDANNEFKFVEMVSLVKIRAVV